MVVSYAGLFPSVMHMSFPSSIERTKMDSSSIYDVPRPSPISGTKRVSRFTGTKGNYVLAAITASNGSAATCMNQCGANFGFISIGVLARKLSNECSHCRDFQQWKHTMPRFQQWMFTLPRFPAINVHIAEISSCNDCTADISSNETHIPRFSAKEFSHCNICDIRPAAYFCIQHTKRWSSALRRGKPRAIAVAQHTGSACYSDHGREWTHDKLWRTC